MDVYERSLERHRPTQGKIEVRSRMRLDSEEDLSLAYTPGVARPCEEIARRPGAAWELTWKGRNVAVVAVNVAREVAAAAERDGVCHR